MLRVNSSEIPEVKPIVIKLTEINSVINTYSKLNNESWQNSAFPTFISTMMADRECETIRELRKFISSVAFDEHTQLNNKQLFNLAVILHKALKNKDVLSHAVQPLTQVIGLERIKAAHMLNNRQPHSNRANELFDSLCRIPSEHVSYVATLYGLDGKKFLISPENIALIEKHSDRIETIYQQIDRIIKNKSALGSIVNMPNFTGFFMFFTQQVQSNNEAWINHFANQLITGAIKHEDHLFEVIYGLAWLVNHGINTPENEKIIDQRPEDLSYLPQVGFSTIDEVDSDNEFNQKLFDFSIEQGAKRHGYPVRLFDLPPDAEEEVKEDPQNNIKRLPH